MTRHQMTDEQIENKFFKNKRGRKATEPAVPVAAEVDAKQLVQASDQFSELVSSYGQGRDLVNQLLGETRMADAFMQFSLTVRTSKLAVVKENKLYQQLSGIKTPDGQELRGTWEEYCRLMKISVQKADEDISNLRAFGTDALESMPQIGIGYRELRQFRKLPEDQKQALIEVAKSGDKEGFVELAEEIIAKHAKEKEAFAAQAEEAKADLETKDRVLADRAARIQELEEQTARKFKPRKGSEAQTQEEQTLLEELDKATAEVVIGLQRLFKVADAAIGDGGQRESIQARGRQAVEFAAQQLAEIATEFNITVNFEELLPPTWLSKEALDAMEASKQKAN